jgi:hypothetical protein
VSLFLLRLLTCSTTREKLVMAVIPSFTCRESSTSCNTHYNSVLEITVSFLGIHKWEPDIYIGFSPALKSSGLVLILRISLFAMWHFTSFTKGANNNR